VGGVYWDADSGLHTLSVIPLNTIKTLRAWARWGQAHNLNYPSMSAMFGERTQKSPLFSADDAPDDVCRMEITVCRLEPYDRGLIIQRWQRHRTFNQLADFFQVSISTINRDLKLAESELHRIFDSNLVDLRREVYIGRQAL
jgi:hypothetical protein